MAESTVKGSSVNTVNAPPPSKPSADWKPLRLLHHQFTANLAALATRDAKLAERLRASAPIHQLLVNAAGNAVLLGRQMGEEIEVIPELVSPSSADSAVKQLCPAGMLTQPALVAGIERGWLWQRLYAAPSAAPGVPGHRLALYFLEKQIDRVWTALHLHDRRSMLADLRVRLFVGEDAYGQFRHSLLDQPSIPWPRQSITVGKSIWPAGGSLEQTLGEATLSASQIIEHNRRDLADHYAGRSPAAIAEQLLSGKPLRVLGITSRYTTFLQYSMRDWLAAFERMGHTTQLLIETLDHEHLGPIRPGQVCAEFKPDLILIIDHYRREFPSLPVEVPCVMWVQDQLPHLFSPAGGSAQGMLDYCLGFARLRMISDCKYPANRYMPAHVGVDEARYCPRDLEHRGKAPIRLRCLLRQPCQHAGQGDRGAGSRPAPVACGAEDASRYFRPHLGHLCLGKYHLRRTRDQRDDRPGPRRPQAGGPPRSQGVIAHFFPPARQQRPIPPSAAGMARGDGN